MIEVKNIHKGFGDKTVIEDVSATMKAGQCNLIIGASGSGKTVLMKCMVGLFEPIREKCYIMESTLPQWTTRPRQRSARRLVCCSRGLRCLIAKRLEQNL